MANSEKNGRTGRLNSLREGLSVEAVVRITGLPLEKVQQLQAELQTTVMVDATLKPPILAATHCSSAAQRSLVLSTTS